MPSAPRHLADDLLLTLVTATVAGSGLIYEYLLSHFAGRILGSVETILFATIGLMIVAMGAGSYLARYLPCPFTGFVLLESAIALLGGGGVLLLGGLFALANLLPQILAQTYGLPQELTPRGGFAAALVQLAEIAPFVMAALLGLLIGMEIPLIARAREKIHAQSLEHNTGMVYGADYLGAGAGAALWILFLLPLPTALSGSLTALANLAAGLIFLIRYQRRVHAAAWLFLFHLVALALLLLFARHGPDWERHMEALLYQDRVVWSSQTRHQHVTLTRRQLPGEARPVHTLFLNGRTQFSTADEHIYHAMLVTPALAASARHERILVIGGGDGLAVRNVLRWQPREVVLLELDPEMVALFSPGGPAAAAPLVALNENALVDPRVRIHFGDAWVTVDRLLAEAKPFDAVIVDLPDPGHPDLNKLYSVEFYTKLKALLAGDGALSIQSTSPYHARQAFLCVGKTLQAAGFAFVEPTHHNVPSFGEWGWTLASLAGSPPSERIRRLQHPDLHDPWATRELLLASFAFGADFFRDWDEIDVNRVGNQRLYLYHHQAWMERQGVEPGL